MFCILFYAHPFLMQIEVIINSNRVKFALISVAKLSKMEILGDIHHLVVGSQWGHAIQIS